ncbi:hypothetical protein CXF30_07245 [Corynebacterium bovis]|nr:hypothetical protein CXF30_07245 [Corynebacterium bovis]
MSDDRSTAGAAAAGAPTPETARDGAPEDHPTAARPETGPGPAPVTVAVVGAGPRGLWAAECLADEARAHRVPVAVDVVDDAPPGAGAAYGPGQPDHWTLNVDSRIVRTGVGTFADWARRHGPGAGAGGAGGPGDAGQPTGDAGDGNAAGDAGQTTGDGNAAGDAGQTTGDAVPFPPRSVVGDFLADSWRALAADPDRAPWFTLRHVRRRVRDVRQVAGGWSVDGVTYDDVLLATGHAATWPGALPRYGERGDRADGDRRDRRVRTVGVYPPDGLRSIPAGARVLVRGAALTFIDAALELTVGRGGRFVGTGTGLTYRPGGGEPAVIRPVCRSGRFMEVKPDPRGRLAGIRDDAAARRAGAAVVTCAARCSSWPPRRSARGSSRRPRASPRRSGRPSRSSSSSRCCSTSSSSSTCGGSSRCRGCARTSWRTGSSPGSAWSSVSRSRSAGSCSTSATSPVPGSARTPRRGSTSAPPRRSRPCSPSPCSS